MSTQAKELFSSIREWLRRFRDTAQRLQMKAEQLRLEDEVKRRTFHHGPRTMNNGIPQRRKKRP